MVGPLACIERAVDVGVRREGLWVGCAKEMRLLLVLLIACECLGIRAKCVPILVVLLLLTDMGGHRWCWHHVVILIIQVRMVRLGLSQLQSRWSRRRTTTNLLALGKLAPCLLRESRIVPLHAIQQVLILKEATLFESKEIVR